MSLLSSFFGLIVLALAVNGIQAMPLSTSHSSHAVLHHLRRSRAMSRMSAANHH
ncbi:hypothetical protein NHJ13051_000508 [Beauveria bassiana]